MILVWSHCRTGASASAFYCYTRACEILTFVFLHSPVMISFRAIWTALSAVRVGVDGISFSKPVQHRELWSFVYAHQFSIMHTTFRPSFVLLNLVVFRYIFCNDLQIQQPNTFANTVRTLYVCHIQRRKREYSLIKPVTLWCNYKVVSSRGRFDVWSKPGHAHRWNEWVRPTLNRYVYVNHFMTVRQSNTGRAQIRTREQPAITHDARCCDSHVEDVRT